MWHCDGTSTEMDRPARPACLVTATVAFMLLVMMCGAANYFALQCFGAIVILEETDPLDPTVSGPSALISRVPAYDLPSGLGAVVRWSGILSGLFGCGMATLSALGVLGLVLAVAGSGAFSAARALVRRYERHVVASRLAYARRNAPFASPCDYAGCYAGSRPLIGQQAGTGPMTSDPDLSEFA